VLLDHDTLESLRQNHPAWRLLRADLAPLVISFLNKAFLEPNLRVIPASTLEGALEDELYRLRLIHGEEVYPQPARFYLDDWSRDDKSWLRKFYPDGEDEAHYDLTPATEKVVGWLQSLVQKPFVATESRILTVFNLLRQIVEGSETDSQARIAELYSKIRELEAEIERIEAGHLEVLDDTAVRDRFLQLSTTARELLADFREVQENFRGLDRASREKIAKWDGTKGQLLEEILGERDSISDSDQGRSFKAFWSFLMSHQRQEELSQLLEAVLEIPAVSSLNPDRKIRKIHYDWLEAGYTTQRTVSTLSQQLRRFLDDKAWLENRRIVEILKKIEKHAVALKESSPSRGAFAHLDSFAADIQLPMERPLYSPPLKLNLDSQKIEVAREELDTELLFSQIVVDREKLRSHVRRALDSSPQITLANLLQENPLEHGLAELVSYFSLHGAEFELQFDESRTETVSWEDDQRGTRTAEIPRLTFVR